MLGPSVWLVEGGGACDGLGRTVESKRRITRLDVLDNVGLDSLVKAAVTRELVGLVVTILVLGGVGKRGLEIGRARHGLVGGGQEDDLAVGRLRHGLHGLEVADLHGRGGREDVGGLAHELGALDLGLGGDDLALADALALGRHRQRVLELLAEDDILDEHTLDLHAPAGGDVLDDLADALGDLLAPLDDVLQDARAHHVPQRRLRALHQRRPHVGDAEGGLVRRRDVVVDDGRQLHRHVVLGHAHLLGHLDDLDLDVDLDEPLAERVDLDEARVDGLVELAELRHQAHVALADLLVRVRAADAAGDGAEGARAHAEGVDHASVPALRVGVVPDDRRIALL